MPIHVEDMTSNVEVFDGALPLTEAQTDQLVRLVLQRLEQKQREAQQHHEATALRRGAMSPLKIPA
jgi:hypothetical protein